MRFPQLTANPAHSGNDDRRNFAEVFSSSTLREMAAKSAAGCLARPPRVSNNYSYRSGRAQQRKLLTQLFFGSSIWIRAD